MSVPYCTPRDVYDLGLSARSFVVRPTPLDPRAGDGLDPATGTFTLMGHGLSEDDLVWLVLIATGGVGALPGGASALVPYHPLPLDFRRFRLSLTSGGAALTFTNAGTSAANSATAWGVLVDPVRRLEQIILAESADVDQNLTAHATPLEPDPITGKFPMKVAALVARCAARQAIAGAMFENAATKIPTERLEASRASDDAQKASWALGQPIYPAPIDQTEGVPDNGARAANTSSGGGAVYSRGCCRPVRSCWVRGTL